MKSTCTFQGAAEPSAPQGLLLQAVGTGAGAGCNSYLIITGAAPSYPLPPLSPLPPRPPHQHHHHYHHQQQMPLSMGVSPQRVPGYLSTSRSSGVPATFVNPSVPSPMAGFRFCYPSQADSGPQLQPPYCSYTQQPSSSSSSSSSSNVTTPLPGNSTQHIGASCTHVQQWKRLRSKRGFAYYLCQACQTRWKTKTANYDPHRRSEPLQPAELNSKLAPSYPCQQHRSSTSTERHVSFSCPGGLFPRGEISATPSTATTKPSSSRGGSLSPQTSVDSVVLSFQPCDSNNNSSTGFSQAVSAVVGRERDVGGFHGTTASTGISLTLTQYSPFTSSASLLPPLFSPASVASDDSTDG